MSRNSSYALVGILVLAAGWFGYDKWQKYANDPARIEAARSAEKEFQAESRAEAVGEAQSRDMEKRVKRLQEAAEDPQEVLRRRLRLTEKESFPLKEDASILTDAVAIPEGAARAPALFFSPLYGSAGDSTSETEVLESMLRFHLRPATAGPVVLNLIPANYIHSPYYRADGSTPYRNLKPEDYLRDANQIGADIFTYGRADVVGGNVVVQLALVDLRTSRSDTFAQSAPKEQLAQVVGGAAQAVCRFAGLDDASLVKAGFAPQQEGASIPSGPAFDAAMKATSDAPDTTAALGMIAGAGAGTPWLYDYLMHVAEGESGVELANEGLRKWPDDPRLLLSKSQVLRGVEALYPSLVLVSEYVRRQPDSLLAAAQLRLTLREIIRQNSWSSLLPASYRGAMRHIDALIERYPDNWALRYDRAICSGNTVLRAQMLMMSDAMEVTSDPRQLKREDYERMAEAYAGLAERTLADFRTAIERRPDNPTMMADFLYWHQQLTDGQGEDAPEKTIVWQYPLIARIALLDPKNVDGDMRVAWNQGKTTGSPQLKILRDVAERTNRDPKVMMRIASNLVETLRHRMDWETDWDNRKENAKRLRGLPEADLFVEALEVGLAAKERIYPGHADMVWMLVQADEKYGALNGRMYADKNGHFRAAQETHKAERYEDSLMHARNVVELVRHEDADKMKYIIVRSLWKLGRHREALYEAEMAAEHSPDKHTFHYLFAVVALELDDRLEEAYVRAKIAAELDPENPGVQGTLKKVAQRVGKSAT